MMSLFKNHVPKNTVITKYYAGAPLRLKDKIKYWLEYQFVHMAVKQFSQAITFLISSPKLSF